MRRLQKTGSVAKSTFEKSMEKPGFREKFEKEVGTLEHSEMLFDLIEPRHISIKKVSADSGKLHFTLSDCREVLIPVRDIPEIKRLSPAQRKEIQVLGEDGIYNMFSFLASETIFRLSDDLRIVAE